MEVGQFEHEENVLEAIPGLEWSHPKPKPMSLRFGWAEVLAMVAVGTTAIVFDFLAFRAAELSKAKKAESSLHIQAQARTSSSNGTNGHACTESTPLAANGGNGEGRARGVKKAGAVVAVRPLRRPTSEVQIKRAWILAAWILGALICHRAVVSVFSAVATSPTGQDQNEFAYDWMRLTILARLCATIGCFVAYLPYLLRSSKYRRDWALGCLLEESDMRRSLSDMLVWTSFVYVVPSVYGLYAHQYGIATLQFMTTVGSTLFHLTRETKFFNLDNVFATSLLITTLWGFSLAVRHGIWWYVAVIGLGGPFAVFCIVRCGMPGLVCRHPSGHGLCRKSNPEYDFFHMLWHLSSGLGTLVSIHYFEDNFPALEAGGGWFHHFPDVPIVPAVSLAISALINLYGNRIGLMPLE